jgi:D-alanyl-D-alanine carboxypeptidase
MLRQLSVHLFTLLLLCSGCKKDDHHLPLRDALQKIVNDHSRPYIAKFAGKTVGMGLYVKGEHQNAYASSGFFLKTEEYIEFRGASTTKTFTAAAILLLHQQDKLNIDDVITANIPGTGEPYVPATNTYAIPYKNKITIRELLDHRAGVFDITNSDIPSGVNAPYAGQRYTDYIKDKDGDHTFTFEEMIGVVAANHLSYFEPGTAFHYSNTGYNLLAVIIERISGKRYDQFLQDAFLTPLHMNGTHFPYLGTDQDLPAPHVSSWLKYNNAFIEIDKDNVSSAVAEGNVITTPGDLATWCQTLYGTNMILNSTLQEQMIDGIPTNESHVSYGLGCETYPPDIGYGHNGARPGYLTMMRYHPGTHTSYIVFVNYFDFDDFQSEANDLEEVIREAIYAVETSK